MSLHNETHKDNKKEKTTLIANNITNITLVCIVRTIRYKDACLKEELDYYHLSYKTS
jgi:hypothetical protein